MIKLPIIVTNSRCKSIRRCPRLHEYAYLRLRRPVITADELTFGTLVHKALEEYFKAGMKFSVAAEVLVNSIVAGGSPYNAARARAMILGYDARWKEQHDNWEVVAVEKVFGPIPVPGQTFDIAGCKGKLDLVIRDRRDGLFYVVEHKTSGENIAAGAAYWRRTILDRQCSIYYDGAASLGWKPAAVIYDVLKKPEVRPTRATPVDKRKYTKDGRLYANQHDTDEHPAGFMARCAETIAEDPTSYYGRGRVVRLGRDLEAARYDLMVDGALIVDDAMAICLNGDAKTARNTDACYQYGRFCDYFSVCCGEASIDDDSLFKTLDSANPELEEVA